MAPFKIAKSAFAASARASSNASARAATRLPRAVLRRGFLAPGDPPPPPGLDLLDYRATATAAEVGALTGGPVPLGRFLDCRRGLAQPIGLRPEDLLKHAAVIGPPGSGKTHSVIVPWIVSLLRAGCSVATIDVKGDLLGLIKAHAARTGGPTGARLWLWDYSGAPSHRWNWLAEAGDHRAVEAAVTSILGKQNKADPQPFFHLRDVRWLRALIRLTRRHSAGLPTPAQLVGTLAAQPALQAALVGASVQDEQDLRDLAELEPAEYSRACAGLLNSLTLFAEPRVRQVSEASDIRMAEISDVPTLLVGVAPLSDGNLGEVLSGIFLGQVIMQVLGRFGKQKRPLFLVVDEAPRLKNRIDFEEVLAVARGASAGVCLAGQDVAQFGDDAARSALLTSCDTLVVLPGSSSESAAHLSKRLGDRLIETRTVSQTGGSGFVPTFSVSGAVATGPVLGNREIMHPPFGPHVGVVHARSVTRAPILTDLSL
ncbi:type IV secretory system conjugative DNA transfer family protein [Amycolatopsis sp. NPDC004625]|uniref:type IV secretory system conjugative DNA transfer family protein n=1 Tax=Amycolatopsis sp. NPDC004625 TaxID=3154670 RepID=UPI0033A5664C